MLKQPHSLSTTGPNAACPTTTVSARAALCSSRLDCSRAISPAAAAPCPGLDAAHEEALWPEALGEFDTPDLIQSPA